MIDINPENRPEDYLNASMKKSSIIRNLKDFQIVISIQLIFFIIFIIANYIGYYDSNYIEGENGGGHWDTNEDYYNFVDFGYFIFLFVFAIGVLIFFWIKDAQKNVFVTFISGLSKSVIPLIIVGRLRANFVDYMYFEFNPDSFNFYSKSEGEQRLDDFFNILLFSLVITTVLLLLNYFVFKYLIKLQEVKEQEEARMQKEKDKEFMDFFESSEVAREFAQKFVNTRISLIKQSIDTVTPQNINTHVRSIITQDIDKLNQLFELNELPVFPSKYLIEYCYKLSEPFRVDFKDTLKEYLTASLLEGEPIPLSKDDKVDQMIDDLLEKYEHMETDRTGKE